VLPVHVALVDESGLVDMATLAEVAGALNEQVQADYLPVWKQTPATVGAYPTVPAHTWAIRLKKDIDAPGALGYHADDSVQPYALVDVDAGDWTVTASHELLEMLADPWGNRLHGARLPRGVESRYVQFGLKHDSSRVQYLLEVCDPCEATTYEVGGVPVSDFLLHSWYRTTPDPRPAYSSRGGCVNPREVADGGYVSFMTPDSVWWQVFNSRGRLSVERLGKFDRAKFASLREFTDWHARTKRP
jgi:hypothetical protein